MAFDVKRFSGSAGVGDAPSVFNYVTNDGIADVTTNGYWDDLGGTLVIGDIINAVLLEDGATIYRTLVVNLSTTVDSKTALMKVFVGDIRDNDGAGYKGANFNGNIGAGSESRLFTYRNNSDGLDDIVVEGYFNDLAPVLKVGDTLILVASDGANFAKVTDVTDGVVSTQLIIFVV